jgi:hypothetical protein
MTEKAKEMDEPRLLNTEHGTRNTEHGTRNTEHGTRNTEPGTHLFKETKIHITVIPVFYKMGMLVEIVFG